MSEPIDTSASNAGDTQAPRSSRRFWQLNLRSMFLLIAVVAVWVGNFDNWRNIRYLKSRVDALRSAVRELSILDPKKIHVVKKDELWYDENRWDIYLPEGSYRLCIATHEIPPEGEVPPLKSTSLQPGEHHIALEQTKGDTIWITAILCDGKEVLRVEEPKDWNASVGSSGGGHFSTQEQFEANETVDLFRRRFMVTVGNQSQTPTGPCNGLRVWIEPVSDATAEGNKQK